VSSIDSLHLYMLFLTLRIIIIIFFFFQAEDGIRDSSVTGVQTCALPIFKAHILPFSVFYDRDHQLYMNAPAPNLWAALAFLRFRSEERRVGKECRFRWAMFHGEKKLVIYYVF